MTKYCQNVCHNSGKHCWKPWWSGNDSISLHDLTWCYAHNMIHPVITFTSPPLLTIKNFVPTMYFSIQWALQSHRAATLSLVLLRETLAHNDMSCLPFFSSLSITEAVSKLLTLQEYLVYFKLQWSLSSCNSNFWMSTDKQSRWHLF